MATILGLAEKLIAEPVKRIFADIMGALFDTLVDLNMDGFEYAKPIAEDFPDVTESHFQFAGVHAC